MYPPDPEKTRSIQGLSEKDQGHSQAGETWEMAQIIDCSYSGIYISYSLVFTLARPWFIAGGEVPGRASHTCPWPVRPMSAGMSVDNREGGMGNG